MRLDIRISDSQQAPQLKNLVATAGIGSVALTWDVPNSPLHKYTEVWVGTDENGSNAERIGNTNDFAYVVVDAAPDTLMYYWVRSVSIYGIPGLISNRAAKAGDAVTGTAAKGLSVGASSQIFSITKAGANSPSQISLFASAQNLQGNPNWSIVTGDATLTLGLNAYQQTLTFANMRSDLVTVQVDQDGLMDQISIVKVKDGADTVNGMLTNEVANITADPAGNVTGSYSNCGGNFKVYNGIVDVSASAAYSVVSQNGVTVKIDANGAYTVSGATSDTSSAILRAKFNGLNIDKVYTLSKVRQGQQGDTGTGTQGPRGTVNIQVPNHSLWSASAATTAIISATGTSPIRGDVVTEYDSSHSFTYFYDGSTWAKMDAYLNGNMLIDGTLSASKITSGILNSITFYAGTGHTPSGKAFEVNTSGVVWIDNLFGGVMVADNTAYATDSLNVTNARAGRYGISSYTNVASPGAYFSGNANGHAIKFNGGITCNAFPVAGSVNSIAYFNNISPITDNVYHCGLANWRWTDVYSVNNVIQGSDIRYKDNVEDSVLGLDFIGTLRPVSYTLKERTKIVEVGPEPVGPWPEGEAAPDAERTFTSVPGIRRHFGLIAQEVKEALGDVDAGIWTLADAEDPDSYQSLRYSELISPMIKAIQELKAIVDAQGAMIKELQGKVTP